LRTVSARTSRKRAAWSRRIISASTSRTQGADAEDIEQSRRT
jgi:hypothetical protein